MKLNILTPVQPIELINLKPMNPDQLQQMVNWLNLQIGHLTKSIKEAHRSDNFGRELQYEGMRDAFIVFLIKLININGEIEKFPNERTRSSI